MERTDDLRTTTPVTRRFLRGGLWENPDFLRLWGAESASLFGSSITKLAFPLMAVTMLDASAAQMGLLVAAQTAPFFLFSLLAGVWVDRRQKRPILIFADIVRAVLLLSIPVAAWLGILRIEQLYAVAFIAGIFLVAFEVAHYAYVPALVGREQVVDANSKLQISHSAADSGGPGVAGILVQLVSAPFALVIDALSYVVSAVFLRQIRKPEQPIRRTETSSIRQDIASGLRALLGHPLLRPIVLAGISASIFLTGVETLYVLYATRDLEISPFVLGIIFAAGGFGAIPGALLSEPVARRFGVGPTIIGGWIVSAATWLLVPLAVGPAVVPLLMVGILLGGIAGTIFNIQQWSLRQIVTPDELQGRVTASHRFLIYGAYPIGALLGGALGTILGLREAIAVCAVGAVISPIPILFTPLRTLRQHPTK